MPPSPATAEMIDRPHHGPAAPDDAPLDREVAHRTSSTSRSIDCGATDPHHCAVTRGPGRGGASRQASFARAARDAEGMR